MARLLSRWVVPVIGGAVALAVTFALYGSLDFGRFVDGLRTAEPVWIVALIATIVLEQILNGWKWRQILYDIKPVGTLRLTGALMAGYGANVLVPLGISPLVRAWLIARQDRLRMPTVLVTTAVARFIDGVIFALFAGALALSGEVPHIEGDLKLGLSMAGGLNILLFGGLLWGMFRFRTSFATADSPISRVCDWVAVRMRMDGPKLREALRDGVIWPRATARRAGVLIGAVAAKLVAASHFVWAGLAVGVVLTPWDYLFVMVFSGFVMVLGRFVRVPGSFVFGAGFALQLLGVLPESSLLMILFNYIVTIILVVGVGLIVLWQGGIDIRRARIAPDSHPTGQAPER